MGGRILVVGATGILRPAVASLVAQGWTVYALARSAAELAVLAHASDASSVAVVPVAVDYTDVTALRAALQAALGAALPDSVGGIDAALIYAPAAGAETLAVLRRAVAGQTVELLTSAAAEPAHAVDPERRVAADAEPFDLAALAQPVPSPGEWWRLVLGWRPDRTWHSPAEISGAALRALQEQRNAVLGRVRPWSDRPS